MTGTDQNRLDTVHIFADFPSGIQKNALVNRLACTQVINDIRQAVKRVR